MNNKSIKKNRITAVEDNSESNVIELIHCELLKIAKEFHLFCQENNLTYYIIGGTFLGAVRHGGFIPWDDDMDIAMPRRDFEKFLSIYPQEKYKIASYRTKDNYKYYFPQLYNERYIVKEKNGNVAKLYIDIFPIDGMPNNKVIRSFHIGRILYHRMKLSFYYHDTIDMNKKRKMYEKILITLAKSIPFENLIDQIKEKETIDRLLRKNDMYDSRLAGTIMGAYRVKEIVETRMFGSPKLYEFEDTQLYGPECADEYLTHMYGDYMKLPEEKDRRSHFDELIDCSHVK